MECDPDRLTPLSTGCPPWHHANNPDSLFVTATTKATDNFNIANTSVFLDNKLYNNSAHYACFLCNMRVFDVLTKKL